MNDVAIFFDNKKGHLDEVFHKHRNIKLVKIPDTVPEPHLSMNTGAFRSYIQTLGENEYVNKMKENGIDHDAFDFKSGIETKHIQILNRWLRTTTGKRMAIFDWDRTLTKVEGFYTLFDGTERHLYEDTLLYLFGGHKRLAKIRAMFQKLQENGVEIFILTNNPASITTFFKRMIHVLSPHIPLSNIVCATLLYQGNKGEAFENHERLSMIRKTRKRRRQTKEATSD
jgi:hypothetical protein